MAARVAALASLASALLAVTAQPEPEPAPAPPEPEPEPEARYELLELHSGANFFGHYDFVQWGWDKTTHGVASCVLRLSRSRLLAFSSQPPPLSRYAQVREQEGGGEQPHDPRHPEPHPQYHQLGR